MGDKSPKAKNKDKKQATAVKDHNKAVAAAKVTAMTPAIPGKKK